MNNKEGVRINKFLAEKGICSRRAADFMIRDKRVLLNGEEAKLGDRVLEGDSVKVDDELIHSPKERKVYLVLNKPVGVICTCDKDSTNNIVDLVRYKERIYPVGRLDVETSGLIILTNDGELANKITKPMSHVEKEYIVEVDKMLTEDFLKKLKEGVYLRDGYSTLPAKVKRISPKEFSITIVEGKNRQIRKMCEKFFYGVKKLKRVRIGNLKLDNLKNGAFYEVKKDILIKLLKI